MSDFNSFKDQVSSEKITLAILEPSKRLIAFSLHSGSIYKITNFDYSVVTTIKDSGVSLTEVFGLSSVLPGCFFNDRDNLVLYLNTSDSANPNSKFIHMTFKLFFASAPVTLPNDLNAGAEVYWEPLISSTSTFGVEIDTVNQQNETIEGTGSLTLFNDHDFWPANFDKLFFDNQDCRVYSWNRDLAPTEAKLLFRGKVESKTYAATQIVFKLTDLLSLLRNAVSLKNISDLGMRNPKNLDSAKQRFIYGRVFGHRPTNLDALIDGKYPLSGTVSISTTQTTLIGVGTSFLKEVSPDDRLAISGIEFTVASVTDNTHLELTEAYSGTAIVANSIDLVPSTPKRFMNRKWCVAGHALRLPTTTVQSGSSTSLVFVASTLDMFDGDFIYFGTFPTGELVQISEVVNSSTLRLANSLSVNPVPGTSVFRPSVQQVAINDVSLVYGRDYLIDSTTGILTLNENAELNAAPTREGLEQATFTNGSRNVTGVGTSFKSFLKSGYIIRPKGTSTWYEISSVDSDTSISLKTSPSGLSPNPKTANIQYKQLVFDDSSDVLHCEVIGRTVGGLTSSPLLRKGPEIVKQLTLDAGFQISEINVDSFSKSQDLVPEEIGFAVPKTFDDTSSITFREVMNGINKSIFGIIFQDNDFKMSYDILRPVIPTNPIVIKESDTLSWSSVGTNKNMVSKTIVQYGFKEYDPSVLKDSSLTVEKSSDLAKYILGTSREKTFTSVLYNQADAQRLCDRWKFLLEFSTNSIKIQTKLQLINAEINDIVDFEHRKFYERFSGTSKRKFLAIEKIQKNGVGVLIECVDLSNAFNRIGLISDNDATWSNSSEDIRIRSGFISDDNGLIDNSESSFQVNLIW